VIFGKYIFLFLRYFIFNFSLIDIKNKSNTVEHLQFDII